VERLIHKVVENRSNQTRNIITQTPLMQDRSVKLYIERQNKAKQQKLIKEELLSRNDGTKWKNVVTKPKPPKITDILIQNLQMRLNA
jgi:hypothetical protein